MKEYEKLTVKEAIEQGYTHYVIGKREYQTVWKISDISDADFIGNNPVLCEKETYPPAGLSSKDIAEILAEHIYVNHCSETEDDTEQVFDAVNELDFSEAENKITEALSKFKFYRASTIRLIK